MKGGRDHGGYGDLVQGGRNHEFEGGYGDVVGMMGGYGDGRNHNIMFIFYLCLPFQQSTCEYSLFSKRT